MALRVYDDYVSRIAAGFWRSQPIWGELQTAVVATLLGSNSFTIQRIGDTQLMEGSLPSGVTAFIPTTVSTHGAGPTGQNSVLVAKVINLGSLDISTPTFTDANAMPSATELNTASQQAASGVLVEVTTVLNATPGSISCTYKNQSGTGGQTSTSQALTASAAVHSTGWLSLAANDWGVQDITAATRTGGTTPTGVVKFWGVIPICISFYMPAGDDEIVAENLLSTGVNPVRLGINDDVNCFLFGTTAIGALHGNIFLVGDS